MNEFYFNTQMQRLIKTFGETNFKSERVDLIFKTVDGLNEVWFSNVVNKFISNSRYAPLPADFVEQATIERNKNPNNFQLVRGSCGTCQDGMVHVESKADPKRQFVFKCGCEVGQKRDENWPTWGDTERFKYNIAN